MVTPCNLTHTLLAKELSAAQLRAWYYFVTVYGYRTTEKCIEATSVRARATLPCRRHKVATADAARTSDLGSDTGNRAPAVTMMSAHACGRISLAKERQHAQAPTRQDKSSAGLHSVVKLCVAAQRISRNIPRQAAHMLHVPLQQPPFCYILRCMSGTARYT